MVCAITSAQEITVVGTITDIDGRPISKVRCFFDEDKVHEVRSDENGEFRLTYKVGSYDTIRFSHVSFKDHYFVVTKKQEKKIENQTLRLEITLYDKELTVVDVFSSTPDTVFGTQEYSVEDFEFDKNGNLVLLTYEKNLASGSVLRLLGVDNKILDSFYINEKAVELTTDFRNNIHLICEEKVYLIEINSLQFDVYLESRDYYFRYVAPVIDTIGDNIYFSNYSELYPAFDYFEFNRKDSVYKKMLKVEDVFLMEFYRAEFKYVDVRTKIWAHQKQLETGIDKEIWVGATVFTQSLYYDPLYAPLFKIGADSLLVFDHYSNQLFTYQPHIGFVDSVFINYHKEAKKSGWEQPLIQDEVNGKIYAMYTRSGYTYLHEINLEDGSIKKSHKLYYKYVDRIKIVNGEVYYVYRPFESIQKKYIYKEVLAA